MRDCCLSDRLNDFEGPVSHNMEPASQVITGLFSAFDKDAQ